MTNTAKQATVRPEIMHDFTTPEGAILVLEDAYRVKDVEAAVAAKAFRLEAALMLHEQFPQWAGDEEMLAQTAQALETSFRAYIERDGFPKFEGAICRFIKREPYTTNIVAVTEECAYSDGGSSTQRLLVQKTENGWRVLNPLD